MTFEWAMDGEFRYTSFRCWYRIKRYMTASSTTPDSWLRHAPKVHTVFKTLHAPDVDADIVFASHIYFGGAGISRRMVLLEDETRTLV